MKSEEPFGVAGIWENWQRPGTEEWVRSFAVLTCVANELMAEIHDRMPVILRLDGYERWLDAAQADPGDLLVRYPSEEMRKWPVSTRVNKPVNDDAELLHEQRADRPQVLL